MALPRQAGGKQMPHEGFARRRNLHQIVNINEVSLYLGISLHPPRLCQRLCRLDVNVLLLCFKVNRMKNSSSPYSTTLANSDAAYFHQARDSDTPGALVKFKQAEFGFNALIAF